MERGRIQGLPKVFKYPLLSQERVMLRTSNLGDTFTESRTLNILDKRERVRIQGLPDAFKCPLLSQKRVKLRNSNYVCTFIRAITTKAH